MNFFIVFDEDEDLGMRFPSGNETWHDPDLAAACFDVIKAMCEMPGNKRANSHVRLVLFGDDGQEKRRIAVYERGPMEVTAYGFAAETNS